MRRTSLTCSAGSCVCLGLYTRPRSSLHDGVSADCFGLVHNHGPGSTWFFTLTPRLQMRRRRITPRPPCGLFSRLPALLGLFLRTLRPHPLTALPDDTKLVAWLRRCVAVVSTPDSVPGKPDSCREVSRPRPSFRAHSLPPTRLMLTHRIVAGSHGRLTYCHPVRTARTDLIHKAPAFTQRPPLCGGYQNFCVYIFSVDLLPKFRRRRQFCVVSDQLATTPAVPRASSRSRLRPSS
jgi:hypothetical protein